jgi:hypothetical protein
MRFIETNDTKRDFVNVDAIVSMREEYRGESDKPNFCRVGVVTLTDGQEVEVDEAAYFELAKSSTFIPAAPGWQLIFTPKQADAGEPNEPHPIIAWALPSGMPVIAGTGVVYVGATAAVIIRPDGKRLVWNEKHQRRGWEVSK